MDWKLIAALAFVFALIVCGSLFNQNSYGHAWFSGACSGRNPPPICAHSRRYR